MFEHKWASIPKLERVEEDGVRMYTDGKVSFPSITTVLGGTADKSGLFEWRKRVGEEKANKVSQAAARRGTAMHSMCEKYLLNEEVEDKGNPDAELLFRNIKPSLDKITEVKCLETGLISSTLGVAGTVDCIAVYDNKLTVIDFKTSSREKKAENIEDYFLQGCFYFWAYYDQTQEMPEQIAILVSSPTAMQEFIVPKSDVIEWTERLKKRIKRFKNKK